MKGNDFGKAIGIDRPANVKDKIKKWQLELDADEGAEVVTGSGPEDDSKAAPSPKLPSTPKLRPVDRRPSPKPVPTPKAVEVLPERPKSAKKPPVHNKLDDEVHIATAPKKRVISDSHWRNKTTQKDANKRTSPKPLPTAWVRPAARKADNSETKVSTPPLQPKPTAKPTPKSAGPRTRSQRKRRPSRPVSLGNDERPTSSGSGSGRGTKSAGEGATVPSSPTSPGEKTELVRVRRRRARTSPRGSLSAEDVTSAKPRTIRDSETSLGEDPANLITVEYESSQVDSRSHDDIRERRRKGRRKVHSDVSQETLPRELTSVARQKTRRRSYQQDDEDTLLRSPELTTAAVLATPPQASGNRLETWLSTTPDPFVDANSRRRRKSKEPVSSSELVSQAEKSDLNASSDVQNAPTEEVTEPTTENRRRRRKRSSALKLETPDTSDVASPTTLTDPVGSPATENHQDGTPTPTLTLKRRGARRSQHSPTKDRSMSLPNLEATEKNDQVAAAAPSSGNLQATELEKLSLKPPFESPTMRRLFPSTGKRLSTIVSVETSATKPQEPSLLEASASETVTVENERVRDHEDVLTSVVGTQLETSTIVSRRSTKRRLASHADLISVLSMPKAGTKSIMSARSIRTNRSRLATATTGDIMDELASDEIKYMRELRTLVDGVIPVLLSCVLSKSDSAVAAGLFSRSNSTDPTQVTKPIIDMGVSLERLKTLHKRVPKNDPDAFLSWAQSAQRVYSDYIAAWRLGFQDVVISLASADDDPFTPAKVVDGPVDGAPWDEGLPRNAEGYVVNGDGERVDVAYMLKRPLVRLKYLAKSIKVGGL
jgi:hypothetical protein